LEFQDRSLREILIEYNQGPNNAKGAEKNNLLFYRPSEWLVGRAGAQF
jgi:hypothetical protein